MGKRRTGETVAVDPFSPHAVRAAYDAVAEDYESAFGDDLANLPLDRAMLEAAADTVAPGGIALDLGCGTGVAGVRVADRGVPTIGVDLSAGMLAVARARSQLPVAQADMRQLPFGAGAMALVIAFYSIQHIPRPGVTAALSEVARVLRPGGWLLVAAHLGAGEVVSEEFLGHDIDPVGGALYSRPEITDQLVAAGFTLERAEERSTWPTSTRRNASTCSPAVRRDAPASRIGQPVTVWAGTRPASTSQIAIAAMAAMAPRVRVVALPMWGSSTVRGAARRAGSTAGSCE